MSEHNKQPATRELWKGNFGFIMATAGAAVGLGNLWKFPYVTGENGGAAFLVVYLVIMLLLGVPLVLAELSLGRAARTDASGAFSLTNKKLKFAGMIAVATTFFILCTYCVIGGWITKYTLQYLTFQPIADPAAYYQDFVSSPVQPIIWMAVFLLLCALIVARGVQKGIERMSKWMMPLLVLILIGMAVVSLTLPGSGEGVNFFLKPDFSKITSKTIVSALGQVFFSLSLGCGCLLTYGSYIKKETNLKVAAVTIPALDVCIAILAGFAIMPALFSFHVAPEQGAGLVFVTLPTIFNNMAGGAVLGLLFLLLVLFAAITSAISMFEVCVAFLVDQFHIRRSFATAGTLLVAGVIGAFASLSFGVLSDFTILGFDIFALLDALTTNLLLPIGGLLICIAVGYAWGSKKAVGEITNEGKVSTRLLGLWSVLVRYIAPVIILLIMLNTLGIVQF